MPEKLGDCAKSLQRRCERYEFKAVCTEFNIKHMTTDTYLPQQNAPLPTEQPNKSLWNYIPSRIPK
jgi:hypothetical protein